MIWHIRTAVMAPQGLGSPRIDQRVFAVNREHALARLMTEIILSERELIQLEQEGVELILTPPLGRETRVSVSDYRQGQYELGLRYPTGEQTLRAAEAVRRRRLKEESQAQVEDERVAALAATAIRPGSATRPSGLAE